MKKYLFLLCLPLLALACGKPENQVPDTDSEPKPEPEVVVPVEAITGLAASAELNVGETLQLSASVLPENATEKTIQWSSSDDQTATVSNTGLVKAIAAGKATVTAACGGKSATCAITVIKPEEPIIDPEVPVSAVTLDVTSLTLLKGATYTLTASVAPDDATDKTVSWSSSDPAVVTVENGVVYAVAPGNAVITAKAGEIEATCAVCVKEVNAGDNEGTSTEIWE